MNAIANNVRDILGGMMPLMRSKSTRTARARNRLRLQNCAMVAFAIGGCAQSAVPVATQHPTTNEPRQHVLVHFTNMSLRPSVAQIVEGGTVAWTNLSSNRGGMVSFPLSVVDHFTCSELRPVFYKTADRLVSIPITGGSGGVALPCPLEPGEYAYRLNLFRGLRRIGPSVSNIDNPDLSLPGKIIVK
ncbi:MAG: hypothetical protein IH827_04435 [Myxococcales bacterium]|nr:hypothetical protein [Myxococcales bacterium]